MTYVHPEFLISPAELAADLENSKRRIFDATVFLSPDPQGGYRAESGRAKYEEGHIPGALFLDLIRDASDLSTGLGFSLPSVAQLETFFQGLGVEDESEVVLYSSGHMMWATRAWWLFRYCGHPRVQVLNGGLRAWRKADLELSVAPAEYAAGSFHAVPDPGLFVDKQAVLAGIGDREICTVNALSSEVYSGEGDLHYGRRGHITGSVNLPYDDLMSDGYFLESAELQAALQRKGMLNAARVITYCGGGISATIDSFACLLVGQSNVSVYDGSMAEWVKDAELPLKTGPDAGTV